MKKENVIKGIMKIYSFFYEKVKNINFLYGKQKNNIKKIKKPKIGVEIYKKILYNSRAS